MKRLLYTCILLTAAVLFGCSTSEQMPESLATDAAATTSNTALPTESMEIIAAADPTEPPATLPPSTQPPIETDVIAVPVSEMIVASREEMPDLEALSGMTSLRVLDLTQLPYTSYSEIEQIRNTLPDCRILWNQMLTDGAFRSDSSMLTLPHATAEDVALLHVFPNLRSVDATGSDAYDALLAFRTANPQIQVRYAYRTGDLIVTESDTSIAVPAGTDAGALIDVLHAFPDITEADLRDSGWNEADVASFLNAFPDMHVRRIVRIDTIKADSETELLDLRMLSGKSAGELCEILAAFPSLKTVALPSEMTDADAAAVGNALPDVKIIGPVTFSGRTFDGGAEEIDLSGIAIAGTEEAEKLLADLPFLKKAVLCECGLTDVQMEELCNAHPDVRFVWTIVIGKRKLRTDAIGFSTKNPSKYTNPNSSDAYNESVRKAVRLHEGDIEALKYCTDLEALDLGHNYLTNNDLKVISGLTKLKILILADNSITDISALTTLKDLEYIELFMNKIPDLSPLVEMPSLVDVNVCNVGVSDLTPLFSLTGVKRLWYAMNPFSREQAKALKDALPDCLCNYTTRNETAEGWRDDPRYQWMRAYFN